MPAAARRPALRPALRPDSLPPTRAATRSPPAGATSAGWRPSRHLLGDIATAGQVALDQAEQAGNAVLGRRAVGDVLVGKRLLVHLRPHVTRVDRVHPQARLL